MMYLNHNPYNLNDLIVQGSTLQYNPLIQNGTSTLTTPYPQQQPQQIQSQNYIPQKGLNQNNGIYTFTQQPATVNPYDPNRSAVAQNSRSTSASSLSSVSSTSSTSSVYNTNQSQPNKDAAAQSILTNPLTSSQTQPFNKNLSLTNNNMYPYNMYPYYNPQLGACTFPQNTQSTTLIQNNTSTNGLHKMNSNITSYSNLNDNNVSKSVTPTESPSSVRNSSSKDTHNVLTTVDPNYQLTVLPSVTKNQTYSTSNQLQYSSTPSNLTTSDAASLNTANNSLLLQGYKNLQNRQNFNNYSHHHYKPASAGLTFLPTHTSLHTAGLNLTPSFTDLAFGAKHTMQNYTLNSKNQFSVGLNMKRKRRFKKPPELRNVLPKNSLMLLHEYRPNVEYRFVCQSGPIHRPMFTMCVDINEHKFEGTGKTKKDARMQAAEKALEFLIQHPEYIQKAVKDEAADGEKNNKKLENDNSGENEEDDTSLEENEEILLNGEDETLGPAKRLKIDLESENDSQNNDSVSPFSQSITYNEEKEQNVIQKNDNNDTEIKDEASSL